MKRIPGIVSLILCCLLHFSSSSSSDVIKGPNPGPSPIKSSVDLRSRFSTLFNQNRNQKRNGNETSSGEVTISKRVGKVRRDGAFFFGDVENVHPSSYHQSYNAPGPVFSTQRPYVPQPPPPPPPRPTVLTYYPGGSGQSTMSPLIFPPVPMGSSTPFPVGPGPGQGMVVVTPRPTGGTATVIPIIGGGGGGGGTDLDNVLPPSPPPDPDEIFPPSPPEIEEVGRMLALKQTRARVVPVGHRDSSGESVAPLSNSRSQLRNNKVVKQKVRTRVRERLRGGGGPSFETSEEEVLSDPDIITDFVFSDIKCFQTRNNEYFGAKIHMKRGYHQPYVRDRPQDPLTSNECRIENLPEGGVKDVYQMSITDLKGCGVEQCGDHMCMTMVFPRVPTLALADDEVTTIKCLPQSSTVSDTRTISFSGDSLDGRRSSSTVEGGSQEFVTEVGVFRRSTGEGSFTKRVTSGGIVQLGEPLELRSIVRGTDGWTHSTLSDVKVWRMKDTPSNSRLNTLDPNDATEVITLVDGEGCRNEEYRVIADQHPIRSASNGLINNFNFKAFLFRGQRVTEPLIVTAKVHACLEEEDCIPRNCDSPSRTKRSPVEIRNSSSIILPSEFIPLRVVGMKDDSSSLMDMDIEDFTNNNGRSLSSSLTCAEKMATAGVGGGLIVLLLCGISFALCAYVKKGRRRFKDQVHPSYPNSQPRPSSRGFLERGNMRLGDEGAMQQSHCHHPHQAQPSQPPICQKPLPPVPQQDPNNNNRMTNADINNVAKILLKRLDKTANKRRSSNPTDYESIDETSSSPSPSSRRRSYSYSKKKNKKKDKNDEVYAFYKNNKKIQRPRSAPSSIRGKVKGSRRNVVFDSATEDSPSPTQTEDGSTEDSDTSGSSLSLEVKNTSKCVGFGGRRTPRNVKNRSSHHQTQQNKKEKVTTRIGRRLSSLYKAREGGGPGTAGGSVPTSWRAGNINNNPKRSIHDSSDLDSAYYGSEINEEVLGEMRDLADKHRRSMKHPPNPTNTKKHESSKILNQGETQTAHFVKRNNDKTTQILIVPETRI